MMSTFQTHGPSRNTDALSLYESLAELTWGWLRDSRRLGLGFSKDTVSDLAMLEIGRIVPNEVGVSSLESWGYRTSVSSVGS